MTQSGTILVGGTELDCDTLGGADVPWVLNGTFHGTPADVDRVMVNLTGGLGSVDLALHLLAPNGTEIAHADNGLATEALDLNGTFPPGNYTIHVSACAAVAGTWTVVATAFYAVAKAGA
jgi:hypothetical protein